MKKTNIIIFVIVILIIIAIFGFAIWDANKSLNEINNADSEVMQNIEETFGQGENNIEQNDVNDAQTNTISDTVNTTSYVGKWYISENAYNNSKIVEELMDRREENEITDEEFETQMESEINTNIIELDVEEYFENTIKFDFKLTSPAPTQREGTLEDITVTLIDNVGTFTYADNWGTSGNGIITLDGEKITLKLETTSAAEGALWGVEGIYTFSYKRAD